MKRALLTFLSFLFLLSVHAQTADKWIAFTDSTSKLIGFKDINGQVKVEPKFTGRTSANYFEHIIAVSENNNSSYESYYLTKTGKTVGRDSLHLFDYGADCESEGFIRFKDKATEKVGMFDKNGDITIPAIYSALSRVHNGHVWALKGATEKYLDEHKEHAAWEGGEELLITTNNEIVLRNFNYAYKLNLYSLKVHAKPSNDPNRQSFKGESGKFYSFIDFDKEFNSWIKSNLVKALTLDKLAKSSHDSITYWQEPNGWMTEAKANFLNRNFELIKARLLSMKKDEAEFFVTIDGLDPYLFKGKSYEKYYNNCGEALREKYPVMDLFINTNTESDPLQDHFGFVRTDNGYRLIYVAIRKGELK